MAPIPVPPGSGGNDRVSGLQQGLRLSDAEGIAAERLDGAAEGSLQEALAIASLDDSRDVQPHTAVDVGAVGERFTAGPLIRLIDARFAEAGRTQVREPDAFSPMPMPPALDIGIALAAPTHSAPSQATDASEVAAAGSPGFKPSEDWQGFAGDAPHAPPVATSPDAAMMQRMQPLSSALDAAVRLAADANVAAEALENLKRLLEHKQQVERMLPQFAGSSPSGSSVAQEPAHIPAEPSPLPLPLHSDPHAGNGSAHASLPPRRKRPPPERRGLDVTGFMAGFALSWAFGVVLYFFMTAG
jgi:hypothetical protein